MGITFSRIWSMPSADTFDIPPIGELVKRYLRASHISIDPFARNKRWATYTNDINPNTAAEYHMDAEDFCKMLFKRGIIADLIIFDPPYSPSQIKECYEGFGASSPDGGANAALYARVKKSIIPLVAIDGIVISFGWNSAGMGKESGFDIEQIILIPHGGAHNDTIVTVEHKLAHQAALL